ncbi:hypothetical protein OQA88_12649 [Cercophora sp. LCS_1]
MPTPSRRSMSDIQSWLEGIPTRRLRPLPHRIRKRKRMSSTPSGSQGPSGPASGGRVKRLRQSSATSSGPSGTSQPSQVFLLPPLSSHGSLQRPRSPTKGAADLGRFARPVEYQPPLPTVRLPDPIRSLDATMTKHEIVTAQADPDDVLEQGFTDHGSVGQARDTFASLQKIVAATGWSIRWRRSEAAWNNHVHTPMLEMALADVEFVQAELITAASILPSFLPRVQLGPASLVEAVSQAKMVDYALVLQPITDPTDSPPTAYQTLLRSLPIDQYALSQTDYGPLRHFPAPVVLETKADSGDLGEAKAQLGVWAAAWFQRMRLLFPQDYQTMPVPLLIARAEAWTVYYACEREDGISIYGPVVIGDTLTLASIYKLLASLKAIGRWVATEFKEWFEGSIERNM